MNKFTTINHIAREILGLSLNEYGIADSIYHLSNNPKGTGWCYASKNTIASFLLISERQVMRIVDKLIEMEIVEKDPENNRHLKTTSKWYDEVIVKGKGDKVSSSPDKMSDKTMTKCHKKDDIMSDNSNNTDTDKDSNIYKRIFDHWNSKDIRNHRKLSSKAKSKIKTILNDFSCEEIMVAINNYDTVLKSPDYFWTHAWILEDFIGRGLRRFVSEAKPRDTFKDKGGFDNGKKGGRGITQIFKGAGSQVQNKGQVGSKEDLSTSSKEVSTS